MAPPSRPNRQRRHSAKQEAPVRLPVDILLQIFSTLSIRDVLSIRQVRLLTAYAREGNLNIPIQTCRNFYEITKLRSLWYLLLRNHVLRKNLLIPGLGNRSIDSFSSGELEECTRRALRLHAVWASRSPPSPKTAHISPVPGSRTRNIALQFLPGREQRWLLSITAVTTERTNWFAIQCWDVDSRPPMCVARLPVAMLAGYAVNSDQDAQTVLALLVPQSVSSTDFHRDHKLTRFCSVEVYAINFSVNSPESAFVSLATFRRRRFIDLRVFSGSSILAQTSDGRLLYWDINTPHVEAELRDTNPQVRADVHFFCETPLIPSTPARAMPSRRHPQRLCHGHSTIPFPPIPPPSLSLCRRFQHHILPHPARRSIPLALAHPIRMHIPLRSTSPHSPNHNDEENRENITTNNNTILPAHPISYPVHSRGRLARQHPAPLHPPTQPQFLPNVPHYLA